MKTILLCEYCQKGSQTHKPTIRIKSASSYSRASSPTNSVRRPGPIEREVKLKELGKMIRGL